MRNFMRRFDGILKKESLENIYWNISLNINWRGKYKEGGITA